MKADAFALMAVTVVVLWGTSCGKKAQTTGVVNADAAPKVLDAAFQGADSAMKAEAARVAEATQQKDPTALTSLTRMLQNPSLSPEQRTALGRCLPAAVAAASAAAQNGDQKAKDSLQSYNAGK